MWCKMMWCDAVEWRGSVQFRAICDFVALSLVDSWHMHWQAMPLLRCLKYVRIRQLSGFPLHKVCTFPAPGLRPGAKQRAQRVCDRRVNSSHLVSKVQKRFFSWQRCQEQSESTRNWIAEEPDCCKPMAGLTSRGVWLASRLLQTSWTPPKLTQDGIPPTMTYGDGTAVLVPVHQKEGSTLQTLCISCKNFGVGPENGRPPRRPLWAFNY